MIAQQEICYLPAWRMRQLIEQRQLSIREIISAHLTQAESVKDKINCFTEIFADHAISLAKKYDEKKSNQLLYGLPLVMKEEAKWRGSRNTNASLVYENNIDKDNDVHIDRLLQAGAIPIAKTTMPEFCLLGQCHSRVYGITRNPWNLAMTPGGSSGGTGASLAAGVGALGTGSDIGGSIRIPAGCSGVVGYKAPYGRIPELSVYGYDSYSHVGPMARSVMDNIMMMTAMAGEHYLDQNTYPCDLDYQPLMEDFIQRKISLKGVKVAYSMDLGCFEVAPDVRRETMKLLNMLKDLGARVTEVGLTFPKEHLFYAEGRVYLLNGSNLVNLASDEKTRPLLSDAALAVIEFIKGLTTSDIGRANQMALEMATDFATMMQNHDVFICPTNRIPADRAEGYPRPIETIIGGEKRITMDFDWYMTIAFNMLSRCPVLSAPSGFGDNHVPTGAQIVGKFYDELPPLKVGLAIEQHAPWYDKNHRPTFA